MPNKLRCLLFIAVQLIIFTANSDSCGQEPVLEDVVYLKNGNVIRGKIIEQVIGQSVKIESRDGSLFVFSTDEIARIAKEPGAPTTGAAAASATEPTGRRRDPFLAGALSFFVPGAGQVYNGEYAKGALHFGMFYIGGILALSNMDWDSIWGEDDDFEGNSGLLFLGSTLALGGMIWSIIDAPRSATRMNKENGWVMLPSLSDDLYLGVTDLRIDGQTTPGVKLILKF